MAVKKTVRKTKRKLKVGQRCCGDGVVLKKGYRYKKGGQIVKVNSRSKRR